LGEEIQGSMKKGERMEENRIPEGWEKADRSKIIFDESGRMKLLGHCRCGAAVWLKQGKWFKRYFTGRCTSCGAAVVGRIRKIVVDRSVVEEDDARIRDVDRLVAHLTDLAVRNMDPILYDAAEMLRELNERHWSECFQIAQYDEQLNGRKHTDE